MCPGVLTASWIHLGEDRDQWRGFATTENELWRLHYMRRSYLTGRDVSVWRTLLFGICSERQTFGRGAGRSRWLLCKVKMAGACRDKFEKRRRRGGDLYFSILEQVSSVLFALQGRSIILCQMLRRDLRAVVYRSRASKASHIFIIITSLSLSLSGPPPPPYKHSVAVHTYWRKLLDNMDASHSRFAGPHCGICFMLHFWIQHFWNICGPLAVVYLRFTKCWSYDAHNSVSTQSLTYAYIFCRLLETDSRP
jgi:hypothetical protein